MVNWVNQFESCVISLTLTYTLVKNCSVNVKEITFVVTQLILKYNKLNRSECLYNITPWHPNMSRDEKGFERHNMLGQENRKQQPRCGGVLLLHFSRKSFIYAVPMTSMARVAWRETTQTTWPTFSAYCDHLQSPFPTCCAYSPFPVKISDHEKEN